MTDPEGTPQEAELDSESSTDEAPADVTQDAGERAAEEKGLTADYQKEGEKAATDDYETRMEKFDNVDASVPVVSLPVKTPSLEKSGEV